MGDGHDCDAVTAVLVGYDLDPVIRFRDYLVHLSLHSVHYTVLGKGWDEQMSPFIQCTELGLVGLRQQLGRVTPKLSLTVSVDAVSG